MFNFDFYDTIIFLYISLWALLYELFVFNRTSYKTSPPPLLSDVPIQPTSPLRRVARGEPFDQQVAKILQRNASNPLIKWVLDEKRRFFYIYENNFILLRSFWIRKLSDFQKCKKDVSTLNIVFLIYTKPFWIKIQLKPIAVQKKFMTHQPSRSPMAILKI